MKKKRTCVSLFFAAFLMLLFGQSVKAQSYQLVWSDEFTTAIGPAWRFETGAGGWGNHELEFYQAANATISNGELVITARRQDVGGSRYTSTRMNTTGSRPFSVTYGRIESRMKLPAVQGLWPAFWMIGSNIGSVGWPACGEIDIMEHINTERNANGTIHWADANNNHASFGGSTAVDVTQYHVYRIDWTPSSIKWFIDGVQYHEANIANNINSTDEFHRPFFIILNMAVGGDWPGFVIDESKLPAEMRVDYVRVYQLSTTSTVPVGKIITLQGSNGRYVSSESGVQPMTCNRTIAQGWEQFEVVDAGGGKVALRNLGKFVSSENGSMPITCNRTAAQEWERFTWIANSDGTVSLQGNNGRYVSTENGAQPMTCVVPLNQAWEHFRVQIIQNAPAASLSGR